MQFTLLLAATFAAVSMAAPGGNIFPRNCPRTNNITVAQTVCEKFLGVGNNESRECERLVEEIAAQSCSCALPAIAYDATADHVYCSTTGPCWF